MIHRNHLPINGQKVRRVVLIIQPSDYLCSIITCYGTLVGIDIVGKKRRWKYTISFIDRSFYVPEITLRKFEETGPKKISMMGLDGKVFFKLYRVSTLQFLGEDLSLPGQIFLPENWEG